MPDDQPQSYADRLAEFAARVLDADPDTVRDQLARADAVTFRDRPVDPYPERILDAEADRPLGAGTALAILDEQPDSIGYYHADDVAPPIDWAAEYAAGRAFLIQRNADGTWSKL